MDGLYDIDGLGLSKRFTQASMAITEDKID